MEKENKEIFRDSIATIDKEGKRNFIFPKKPKGKLYNYRTYVSWVLLAFLLAAPFIKVKGNQFLLFNVLERKFHIFGFPFWPQDFHLLVISILLSVVFIILFTVVFGRIFCGWMCPQTIFMEMVFRKIEYLIEGDRSKQIKLDKQAWDAEKIRKRVTKWIVFFIISFIISNVFLAYIIGADEVLGYITDGPMEHITTLIKLLAFTAVFYFVFAWFREQVCIIVCPYGRLQGVLLDDKSINVAYDFVRGEGDNGRKKIRKDEDREELGHGDCIDCKQCVQVCPTGIDIRNGTQLECINCTACIDACDEIMDKTGFEKGLIRYASEDNIEKKEKFKFNARLIAYSAILSILIIVLVTMLFLRNDVEATVLRLPGQTFISTDTTIKNVYTVKLINKTTDNIEDVEIKLVSHKGTVTLVGGNTSIEKQGLKEGTLFIEIDKKDLNSSKEELEVGIYSKGELIETTTTNFTGPMIIK
ncbi:cytochrome c oxidase accessory protein FixG [Lutibacter oricola]|uniref:Cytochrome c oxidase accessory protein FixG n=1 Tax=Lutibacter oricola TaxID=762486 RepID=A0A1H2VWN0_9FLAO|nr:cytochrome c oxidase accessory protein CcoG [Lutibacter oricola]SDW72259.1 cytochrome c oxidase accessory protein FixG [Lutibacter oricola]